MRKCLSFCLAAILLAACTPKGEYRIHGYTPESSLNGVQIFLIPLHDESPQMVDSVIIHENKFEFRGHGKLRREWMAELRLDKHHRIGYENLLVVTEPGDIYVTIGRESSTYGTPQNDSLQVWKQLTMDVQKATSNLRRMGMTEEADSVRTAYFEHSRQMWTNLGPETTLGAFLQRMFPSRQKSGD